MSDLVDLFWDTRGPRTVEVPVRPASDDIVEVDGLVDDPPKPPLTDREKEEMLIVGGLQVWAIERVIQEEMRAIAEEFDGE